MSFKMKRTLEMRRVESAFADYLENEDSIDLLWSDKVGYVFLTINEKTHQSESCEDLHTAPQLCRRLLDDMAITVMMQTKRNHNFTNMDKDEAVRVRAFWKPVIEKLPTMLISAMKFSAKHKKMRRKTALIYSEAERKEIERVYGVFKDYIHASKFLDFVWSEKLGYLLLHIDPTKNTIEEDQIITSADELCAELFNEVATDVFQEAKREHFYPDADDDEIAEIRRRWQPYLDLLPEYRSSCRAFHTAE